MKNLKESIRIVLSCPSSIYYNISNQIQYMICTLSAFQVNVLAGLFCCLCCLCTKMTSAEAQLAGFHDLHNSSYTLMALSPLATHRPKASKANSFVGGPTGYINASCCLKFTK